MLEDTRQMAMIAERVRVVNVYLGMQRHLDDVIYLSGHRCFCTSQDSGSCFESALIFVGPEAVVHCHHTAQYESLVAALDVQLSRVNTHVLGP